MASDTKQINVVKKHNIIWLSDALPHDFKAIGLKAIHLSLVDRMHLPVPRAFCLTTHAYESFLDSTGLTPPDFSHMELGVGLQLGKKIQQALLKYPLPVQVSTDLREGYRKLMRGREVPLVLRLSVVYDSPFVFAKLLRPMLNLIGMIELEKAIKICWAYVWSEEMLRYRYQQQIQPRFDDIALIIQEQIAPEAAGSAITFNPVTQRN